ncbi:hypothetical protein P7C70_g7891, partial [Phenoliferia sp. Uapishka_3]
MAMSEAELAKMDTDMVQLLKEAVKRHVMSPTGNKSKWSVCDGVLPSSVKPVMTHDFETQAGMLAVIEVLAPFVEACDVLDLHLALEASKRLMGVPPVDDPVLDLYFGVSLTYSETDYVEAEVILKKCAKCLGRLGDRNELWLLIALEFCFRNQGKIKEADETYVRLLLDRSA